MSEALAAAAQRWIDAGECVLTLKSGEKSPRANGWAGNPHKITGRIVPPEALTAMTIADLTSGQYDGYGVQCGGPGGLVMIEFEGRTVELMEPHAKACEAAGIGEVWDRIRAGYVHRAVDYVIGVDVGPQGHNDHTGIGVCGWVHGAHIPTLRRPTTAHSDAPSYRWFERFACTNVQILCLASPIPGSHQTFPSPPAIRRTAATPAHLGSRGFALFVEVPLTDGSLDADAVLDPDVHLAAAGCPFTEALLHHDGAHYRAAPRCRAAQCGATPSRPQQPRAWQSRRRRASSSGGTCRQGPPGNLDLERPATSGLDHNEFWRYLDESR